MDWEKLAKAIRRQNWIILLLLAFASYLLMRPAFTLGVILGGLMIIANFNVLQRTVRRSFGTDGRMAGNPFGIVGKYYLRLLVMGAMIYLLISRFGVDPVGLVVGLSIVVISIVQFGIRAAWKLSSGEAV
jgi:hypothetical protein